MQRSSIAFWLGAAIFLIAMLLMTQMIRNEYPFFAGYVILQFVVLSVAWTILGGYAGYVNFGTNAFFGVGVYTAVLLIKAFEAPLGAQILVAAGIGGLLGFGVGLLTLRMRGIFFSIATIALAIIIETTITNWRFVGGAAGIQLQRPPVMAPFDTYVKMLFFVQALLVVVAVAITRFIQNSRMGRGLQALRDDELAAECAGVPTLRLKLLACMISGALISAGGAPAAMYLQFANPNSAFNLNYSVSVLAMSLIGGTAHWIGPVIGAIVLGVDAAVPGGDYFLGNQRARSRIHAGAVRRGGAEGHHRPRQSLEAQGRRGMTAAAPETSLLRIDALSKNFGGFVALDNIGVEIRKGERFGLIGPNGSGKTTLVNCISGALRPNKGAVLFAGEDITQMPPNQRSHLGIARSFQIPRPFRSMTVLENLMVALDFAAHRHLFETAAHRRDEAMSTLTRIGLASKAKVATATLTQVELRKMELARAMVTGPKLLISDEAMAGLSTSEVDEVLDLLLSSLRRGHRHHHDRAHHAGGDALLRARDVPRCRQDHRHRRARRGHVESASAGGLSWHLACPSRASMPAMAR